MSEHYKVVCNECGVVITQCRCMDANKETRYGVCEKCREPKVISETLGEPIEEDFLP